MQLINFVNTPKVELSFTDEELQTLMECSEKHYDGACQESGKEGGFLYKMQRWQELGKDEKSLQPTTHVLTFREVDRLCKICEVLYSSDVEKDRPAMTLHYALRDTLMKINDEYRRINP